MVPGCLGSLTDDADDECEETLEFHAYVVETTPDDVSVLSTRDDRVTDEPLFETLFAILEEWDPESSEREPVSGEYGELSGRIIVAADACSSDAERAEDVYDDLPYEEPDQGPPGVYFTHEDAGVTVSVSTDTVSDDETDE